VVWVVVCEGVREREREGGKEGGRTGEVPPKVLKAGYGWSPVVSNAKNPSYFCRVYVREGERACGGRGMCLCVRESVRECV